MDNDLNSIKHTLFINKVGNSQQKQTNKKYFIAPKTNNKIIINLVIK